MTPGTWAIPSPEQVEANVRLLRQMLGAEVVDPVVEIDISPEQVELLRQLGLAEPSAARVRGFDLGPRGLAPDAEAILMDATGLGGVLDPGEPFGGVDVVYVTVIKTMAVTDPTGASKLARRWFAHLTRLAWNAEEEGAVHPVVFAVAAYAVAFAEQLRGRHHEVRRWLREADAHVEHETPPELAVLAYLRACRLWVG